MVPIGMKYCSPALAIAALLCSTFAAAQRIETLHDATRRARSFLRDLGKDWPGAGASAERDSVEGTSYDTWVVRANDGSWLVSLDTVSGHVTGFHDLELDSRARSLQEPLTEPRFDQQSAIRAAEAFLRAAVGVESAFRLTGTAIEAPTSGYDVPTYQIAFAEPAPEPWEGPVNQLKVTVDGQEGRVLLAGGTTRLRFSPPGSVVSTEEAVFALRDAFRAEAEASRARRDFIGERAWQWPGDAAVTRALTLRTFAEGSQTAGSTVGRDFAAAGVVRVAYRVTLAGVDVVVDASTGEPLSAKRVKHVQPGQTRAPETGSRSSNTSEMSGRVPTAGVPLVLTVGALLTGAAAIAWKLLARR